MAAQETRAADRRQGRNFGRRLAVLAFVTAAVAPLGVPAGFIWAAITPRVAVIVTGHGAADVINPETKAFIAADGWFCVIGVIGGLIVGVAGYLMAVRRNGAVAAAGLILGGLAASLVEWWIGASIGHSSFRGALLVSHQGAVLHAPLVLRAHAALVFWPLTTALVVGVAELLSGQRHRSPPDHALPSTTQHAGAAPPPAESY
ncbi:MAG TPA: hypothetical protein VLW50_22705 [Streptosporangiaceae bacterium]|nr:hypothetical protein [Streptosporangiaceae bacterium]